MSDLFPVPPHLEQAEYALLIFQLEAREYFDLPPLGLLRLRREFQQAIRALRDAGEQQLGRELQQLLEPVVPVDPQLRKRVQRPAPPLVLRPDPGRSGLIEPGDWLELPVLFLGCGMASVEAFARLLQQVARQGLVNGGGVCELATVEAEDGSGRRTTLWNRGPLAGALTPVVNDLKWWLERQPLAWNPLRLEFVTPARFLRGGRPLFNAGFAELFPFILRRVTAMLAAHCRIEAVPDPAPLLQAAASVAERHNDLHWRDWRPLAAGRGGQDLGGLCGALELSGSGLGDLLWILQLGSLLQVGKGAPYGAGRYQLCQESLDVGSC